MAKIKFKGKDYYQIEKDDDYFKIGKKLFNKYSAAPLIAQANPDFEFLKTGAVIALPENVPDKIMIPLKKKNHKEIEAPEKFDAPEPVSAEEDLENALAEEEGNAELDAPLAEMYEDEEEKEPETAIEPVVIEPEAVTVPVESILPPDLGDELTETTADLAEEPKVGVPEAYGDGPIDLPPTPDDAGENPEVNKDWETIAGMERREDKVEMSEDEAISEPVYIDYSIQSGDTLTQIALDNNVTLDEIKKLNGIENENELFIDQKLVVPQRWGDNSIIPEKISEEGIEFIKEEEFLVLNIYNDMGEFGNCTIGYGHLLHKEECDGRDSETEFANGITEERALELLQNDIDEAHYSIILNVSVPLSQNQYDALLSFSFNAGPGYLEGVAEFLNENSIDEAMDYIKSVNKTEDQNGNLIEALGLTSRREKEIKMFLGD